MAEIESEPTPLAWGHRQLPAAADVLPATTEWRGYRWPLTPSTNDRTRPAGRFAGDRTHRPGAVAIAVGNITLAAALLVGLGVLDFNKVLAIHAAGWSLFGNDLVFGAFFLATAWRVAAYRRDLSVPHLGMTTPLAAAALLALVALILIARDAATGQGAQDVPRLSLRLLPYFCFAPLLVCYISNERDLAALLSTILRVTALGCVLTIFFAMYGDAPIPGGAFLNSIVVRPGPQIAITYGDVHRANLPVSYAAIWCFFYCLATLRDRVSPLRVVALELYATALVLNLSRGLYAGVLLALILFAMLTVRGRRSLISYAGVLAGFAIVGVVLIYSVDFDIQQGVIDRIENGIADFRQGTGTWGSLLDDVQSYQDLRLTDTAALFGYGFSGAKSGISPRLIELGPIDLLYRGGIVGTLSVVMMVTLLCSHSLRAIRRPSALVIQATALATICTLAVESIHMLYWDPFYYEYFVSLLGCAIAMLAIGEVLYPKQWRAETA
jgi:hypothetical protein